MLKCIAKCPKGYDRCCFNCELKNLCRDSCTASTEDPENCKMHVHTEEVRRERREKRMDARFLRLYIIGFVAFLALLFTLMVIIGNQNADTIRDTDILNQQNAIVLELDKQSIDGTEKNRSQGEIEALGTFTITHYCACGICCGKSDGICKNGEKAIPDYTISTDPKVIPTGSIVTIDGKEYEAMDTGGAIKGNKIDIFESDHNTALRKGIEVKEVTFIEQTCIHRETV